MKKVIVALCMALVLTACSQEKKIINRLDMIYADVFDINAHLDDPSYDPYQLYCTKAFVEAMRLCDEYSAMTGDLIIDWDLWTQAQDIDNPSMSVKSVNVTGKDTAEAVVEIFDFGVVKDVQLLLVKEDGAWYIDDFQHNFNGEWISSRVLMENGIAE